MLKANTDNKIPFVDIHDFLLANWSTDLKFKSLPQKVAVHEPCSQRVLQNTQSIYTLLEKIPEIEIIALPDNQICCGAGGCYQLTQPQNAQSLRAIKQQKFIESGCSFIVSSNWGCVTHLKNDLPPSIQIKQVITLLATHLTS